MRGICLPVSESTPEINAAIVGHFRADRGREYDELAERCGAFLAEIGKETRAGKFIFAELEESEQDLEKLVRWLAKIWARDFFPDDRAPRAIGMVDRCRNALEVFSRATSAPVTVIGVGSGLAGAESEQVRRAVALAMSVLENTGVMALGHIAVTGSPARTVARVARARGARVVVLDYQGQASGGLAAELRRRMYGSGIVVVSAAERGNRGAVPS